MSVLLAVPCSGPEGLDAEIADHFGLCGWYAVVETDGGGIVGVQVLEGNPRGQGDCLDSALLLATRGVRAVAAEGIGERPLRTCRQFGMVVLYAGGRKTAREAAEGFLAGALEPFRERRTCRTHPSSGFSGDDGILDL